MLSLPCYSPNVPQNLFLRMILGMAQIYFGSPAYDLDILKLKHIKEHIESKLRDKIIITSKLSLVSLVILFTKLSGKLF